MANPNGNPNYELWKERKTGPVTEEGKERVKRAVAIANSQHGRYSKYLNSLRICNKCPLRPKEAILEDGTRRVIPGLCGYYQQDKKACELGYNDFKIRVRDFADKDPIELQRELIIRSVERAELSEMQELLKEGRPGIMTKEYSEQALKYNEGLIKLTQKDKGDDSKPDVTQQFLHEVFDIDNEKAEGAKE